MKKEHLILVTNDDSVNAKGIHALVEVAKQFGDVVVVAPDKPQSGMGHAITIHDPLRLKKTSLFENTNAYSCSGTPVDCVKLAIYEVLGRKPDLILSGINHGENSSTNVLYSGTMSAAIEGAMEGISSIGFSLADYEPEADFSATKHFASTLIEKALNMEVNISKTMGNFIKFDFGVFYTHLNDAMVRRAFQVNGNDSLLYDGQMRKTFSIQNAAKAEVYGGNIGVELKLPKGFSIESRFNYQKGTEEMDNGNISSSRHAAPAFGITKLNFKTNQLQMQLYMMYSAAVKHEKLNEEERQKPFIYTKDKNGNSYSPEWFTLNYKLLYQFSPLFKISAGVENILDKMYRPYSSGVVAPGRNFILSLNLSF
jgi:hypothetical protein